MNNKDIQVVLRKQFRAVIARNKRLLGKHKEGVHKDHAINCESCRRGRL